MLFQFHDRAGFCGILVCEFFGYRSICGIVRVPVRLLIWVRRRILKFSDTVATVRRTGRAQVELLLRRPRIRPSIKVLPFVCSGYEYSRFRQLIEADMLA